MIKIMGCVLILTSCWALGLMKAASYKARSIELESIMEIIKLLELEITYRKEPLSKSFQKAALQKHCWFSAVLQSCSEGLTRQQPLQEAWTEALQEHETESPLTAQDVEILKDMALGLGRCDTDGQSRLLEPTMMRIRSSLADSRQREAKQGRMYKGLGISSGLIIVIMII